MCAGSGPQAHDSHRAAPRVLSGLRSKARNGGLPRHGVDSNNRSSYQPQLAYTRVALGRGW